MKTIFKINIILLLFVFIISCSNDSSSKQGAKNVYITGKIQNPTNGNFNYGTIWKDEVASYLTPDLKQGNIDDIFVTDAAVYAVGEEDGDWKVWKNKTLLYTIPNCDQAIDLFVSGNDVYVCGKSGIAAKYWKNNVEVVLSAIGETAEANAISVLNNDVFVAGFETFEGKKLARVWKNNTIYKNYSDGTNNAEVQHLSISNNNIYVVAEETIPFGSNTKFYKNLDQNPFFTIGSTKNVNQFCVSDDTVYAIISVGGFNTISQLYKNGEVTDLPSGFDPTFLSVSGTDVYIFSYQSGQPSSKLYKNGTITDYLPFTESYFVSAMFVK
jgi:hypothetical protein